MSYTITNYTRDKAKEIGVKIYPASNIKYKLDVYDLDGNYISSVGANGMSDYPTYQILESLGHYPKGYAKERRRLYKIRHKKDISHIRGYLADYLLW